MSVNIIAASFLELVLGGIRAFGLLFFSFVFLFLFFLTTLASVLRAVHVSKVKLLQFFGEVALQLILP